VIVCVSDANVGLRGDVVCGGVVVSVGGVELGACGQWRELYGRAHWAAAVGVVAAPPEEERLSAAGYAWICIGHRVYQGIVPSHTLNKAKYRERVPGKSTVGLAAKSQEAIHFSSFRGSSRRLPRRSGTRSSQ